MRCKAPFDVGARLTCLPSLFHLPSQTAESRKQKMNDKSFQLLEKYLPKTYISQGQQAITIHENEIRILLEKVETWRRVAISSGDLGDDGRRFVLYWSVQDT